jgi:hypothetical protein
MLKLTLQLFVIVVLFERAYSWGGRFNRFSPEMLSNMGYGGYGNNRHSPQVIISVFFSLFLLFLSRCIFALIKEFLSLIHLKTFV